MRRAQLYLGGMRQERRWIWRRMHGTFVFMRRIIAAVGAGRVTDTKSIPVLAMVAKSGLHCSILPSVGAQERHCLHGLCNPLTSSCVCRM